MPVIFRHHGEAEIQLRAAMDKMWRELFQPRRRPADAHKISSKIRHAATQQRIDNREELNYHNHAITAGQPEISDRAFDALMQELTIWKNRTPIDHARFTLAARRRRAVSELQPVRHGFR